MAQDKKSGDSEEPREPDDKREISPSPDAQARPEIPALGTGSMLAMSRAAQKAMKDIEALGGSSSALSISRLMQARLNETNRLLNLSGPASVAMKIASDPTFSENLRAALGLSRQPLVPNLLSSSVLLGFRSIAASASEFERRFPVASFMDVAQPPNSLASQLSATLSSTSKYVASLQTQWLTALPDYRALETQLQESLRRASTVLATVDTASLASKAPSVAAIVDATADIVSPPESDGSVTEPQPASPRGTAWKDNVMLAIAILTFLLDLVTAFAQYAPELFSRPAPTPPSAVGSPNLDGAPASHQEMTAALEEVAGQVLDMLAAEDTPLAGRQTVAKSAPVHASARAKSEEVGRVKPGDVVEVLGANGNWLLIQMTADGYVESGPGWLYVRHLEPGN